MKQTQNPYALEADVFGVLAHPARLQILELLRAGEVCVCHIQAVLGQRQAYISQHLLALRQAGLVTSRKDGLRVYYQVSDPGIFAVLDGMRRVAYGPGKQRGRSPVRLVLTPPRGRCKCPQCMPASQSDGVA
jgi:DNA-binding transcriptional ArsR family regulator